MEDYKRKYETAINQAKEELKVCGSLNCDAARQIFRFFPELKESEDEKIKKTLINFLDDVWHLGKNANFDKYDKADCAEWIAWLKKQDPKKHEEELEKAYKTADEVQYRKGYEDAKREFEKQGEQKLNYNNKELKDVVIAELSKYNINDLNAPWAIDSTGIQYPLYFANLGVKWQKEQKPAWSEEDENMLQKALSTIRYALSIPADKDDDPCFAGSSTIDWLKSLKERIKT